MRFIFVAWVSGHIVGNFAAVASVVKCPRERTYNVNLKKAIACKFTLFSIASIFTLFLLFFNHSFLLRTGQILFFSRKKSCSIITGASTKIEGAALLLPYANFDVRIDNKAIYLLKMLHKEMWVNYHVFLQN